MYLSKLLLKAYGQFNSKEVELKEGINIIYSRDRSKRRSFKDFIVSMLYGSHGRNLFGIGEDVHSTRKPYGNDYKGAVYVNEDGKPYLVERTFLAGAKKTSILDLKTGKQEDFKGLDALPEHMVALDKSTYKTGLVIDDEAKSDDAVVSDTDLVEKTRTFVKNVTETGCSDINFDASIEYLREQKNSKNAQPMVRRLNDLTQKIDSYESIDKEIEGIEDEIKKLDEDFAIEAAKRKRVARRMIQNEDGTVTYEVDKELNKKIDTLTETGQDMMSKPKEKGEVKFTDRLPVIFGMGLLIIVLVAAVVYMLPFESPVKKLFVIFTVIFVIFTIVDGLRVNGFFDAGDITPTDEDFKLVLKEIEDEKEEREAIEFDMTFAKEYAKNKDALRKKESALLDKRNERNKLQAEFNSVFKKKSELEEESYAITAAMNQLITLRDNMKSTNLPKVTAHISDYIDEITGGKYDDIRLDREYNISVSRGGVIKDMSELSAKDIRLVYLAVRFGLSDAFITSEAPLVLLDLADDMDTDSLGRILSCICGLKSQQQIIITSDSSIEERLSGSGLAYNYAEI
ncbi:MAG: hypothetical protein IJJ74_09790 [Eubacterium sp.]|nr:hypothetical protein [Eubacterium sp.]